MNPVTNPLLSTALPEAGPVGPVRQAQGGPSHQAHDRSRSRSWNTISAVASVVLKELYRRKDFYVLFVLTALLTLLMGSVSLFSQDAAVRATREICLALIWISSLVIVVTATARQIPTEREQRTLFPLLAKPVSRSEFVLGKFAGCWSSAGLCLLVFYVFFAVIAGAQEHEWPLANYFQLLTLHWFMLGIVCALTLLGSLIFAAPSSNNTITLVVTTGILLMARHLNKVAMKMAEPWQSVVSALYFVLPHLEFYDARDLVIHNFGLVRWGFWALALVYAVVWMALFLTSACWLFRRRAIH
jgi:ABC-type transport system involved in multi-copper enzyme maturation permease subunit